MIRKSIPAAVLLAAFMTVRAMAQVPEPTDPPQTAPATTQATKTEVPVKAVVLFSSGVGYFEHFGTVKGQSSAELRFKSEQINDILKSLVLQDMDGGKVSAITYPSLDPLDKTLKSFQIDISANPTLAELLNQLRGAKVTIIQSGETTTGTILGVETKQRPAPKRDDKDQPPIETHVMNLITEKGIIAVDLDSVSSVTLNDAELQSELNQALAALAQARDQDKKPVQISFTGDGDRRVRLGYVVETPVWKTSYRLILPGSGADEKTKPSLQGWAIVENQTDNDWNDVQLSLVSGRPISFVMDLYQPLYIPRPVVQQEFYASLRPQVYAGGVLASEEPAEMDVSRAGAETSSRSMALNDTPAAAPATPGLQRQKSEQLKRVYSGKAIDATSSIQSVASASQVGELFEYTVGNVTLQRQKSAMIPIITDPIEVERLSIYNASVLPKNPLNGARVKNTTGKHLLQGPITVLDANTYAGDAQIDNLPPGQERLLSYGVDLQVLVDSTQSHDNNALLTGKIDKGTLILTRKLTSSRDYVSENKSDKEKSIVIEHPRRGGWKLTAPDKPMETTDALYRFKGKLEPHKPTKLTVSEEIVQGETLAILPCDLGQLVFYSKAGEIPESVRKALSQAATMRQAVTDTQRTIEEKKKQLAEITAEQQRIRDNLKTVQQGSAYHDRLLKKLNDQETKIESIQGEIETLTEQMKKQRSDLESYVGNLTVG